MRELPLGCHSKWITLKSPSPSTPGISTDDVPSGLQKNIFDVPEEEESEGEFYIIIKSI